MNSTEQATVNMTRVINSFLHFPIAEQIAMLPKVKSEALRMRLYEAIDSIDEMYNERNQRGPYQRYCQDNPVQDCMPKPEGWGEHGYDDVPF